MAKKSKKKSRWANDEFDDYKSAGEDSEDCNYRPNAGNQAALKKKRQEKK